jgi:Protein kinase domain
VLLHKDGAVKLADLGIATAAEQSRITRSGAVLGTAAYMAPERLEGRDGDAAADVYALAAVAFEGLTGRKPIEGSTPLEVAQRVVNEPVPDLRDVLPGAPAPAAAVLARGLAKDPAQRPPSAGGLVKELERAFEAEPTAPTRPVVAVDPLIGRQRQPLRSRRPLLPILGALAAVAAVALIAVLASGGDGPKHRTAPKPTPAHEAKKKRSAQATAPAATPAPGQSPTQAVNSFYQHAARHEYDAAWSMLTDNAKAELGSERSFAAGQSTLRSISFPVLRTIQQTDGTAIVLLRSNAVHTDRTDHVCGNLELLSSGSAWLIDAFHLDACPSSAPSQKPARPHEPVRHGRKRGKVGKAPKPSKARGDPGAEGGD